MNSSAVAMSVRQNTAEWEEARLDGIGSSDAPVIAGERGSLFELWAVKTREIPVPDIDRDTAAMFDMGHRLEPIIAAAYTERQERPLRRVNRMLRRREDPWAFASLDRVSARKGERRIVELKSNPWTRWGIGEDVPGDVQTQVQHQLWVTGYDVADVAVLVRGYDLKIHTIERDDGFIADLVYLEREFYGWVQARTRPPVDGSVATRRALQRMFPAEYGEVLPATPDVDELAYQLQAAQAAAKAANDHEATVKNALRAVIGDAAGVVGNGWRITWKKNRDGSETDWRALAAAYRQLLLDAGVEPEKLEALTSLHTTTKQGARVLRSWFANQEEEAAA